MILVCFKCDICKKNSPHLTVDSNDLTNGVANCIKVLEGLDYNITVFVDVLNTLKHRCLCPSCFKIERAELKKEERIRKIKRKYRLLAREEIARLS